MGRPAVNDLTEARPRGEVVTAQQVFDVGRNAERDAVVAYMNSDMLGYDEDTRFILQAIVMGIKANAHRAGK
jgi:hypothetical protein